jgi:putative membrane protein
MRLRIILLYFVMIAGGLWNALGVFQDIMQALASPLIIALGLWVIVEGAFRMRRIAGQQSRNFLTWALAVLVISIAVEAVGVHTGIVFGSYTYGIILQPQIGGVPVAIGFAWVTMMVASASVVIGLSRRGRDASQRLLALAIAFVMTGFDSVMESAATALGYWTWTGGTIPALNYLTWFLLSFVFALAGFYMRALPRQEFRFGLHVFLAQASYFILTSFGAWVRTS